MMCASTWCDEHETFGCHLDEPDLCPRHGTPLVEHAGWIACRACLENATEES